MGVRVARAAMVVRAATVGTAERSQLAPRKVSRSLLIVWAVPRVRAAILAVVVWEVLKA
jgi:hypothetical protein